MISGSKYMHLLSYTLIIELHYVFGYHYNWLQIVHCIRVYGAISNASFVFFETDKGITWKLLPITAFVLQVNCLEAVCWGLETPCLCVCVCVRATHMVYNVCLLRKVATEIAVLPWVVEMSCFDMPCLPYKK